MPAEAATCGVPGCRGQAVFAHCSAQALVILCRRHLERLVARPADAEPSVPAEPDAVEEVGRR